MPDLQVLVNTTDCYSWAECAPWWEKWKHLLPDWIYTVEFTVDPHGEYCMEARVSWENGDLVLALGKQWAYTEPQSREKIFLHELLHCYNVPVAAAGKQALLDCKVSEELYNSNDRAITRALELCNTALVELIWRADKERAC